MSERNGDKARFWRQRLRRIQLRARTRAAMRKLENRNSRPSSAATPGK